MVSHEHLGFESGVPFGLFSSLVPYLTVMRSVVPNGRDVILCRNGIFQSIGAEIVCVAQTSHSSHSINIKISPQCSSFGSWSSICLYAFLNCCKSENVLESKQLSAFWHDSEKWCQLLFSPSLMHLLFLSARVSRLLKHPKVSNPLCFHWQLILLKRSFGFWFIS